MHQDEAAEHIRTILESQFIPVVEALAATLRLPAQFLQTPSGKFSCFINQDRMFKFSFDSEGAIIEPGQFSFMDIPRESASYAPYLPAICACTPELEADAKDAAISDRALLEILVLHELVHLLMMNGFTQKGNIIAERWLKSKELRYIHESTALKAGESAFNEIYKIAKPIDVTNYLNFVERRAQQIGAPSEYTPYFTHFRNLTNDQFWNLLSTSIDFQWNELLGPALH